MSKYTPAIIDQLRSIGSFDYASATQFAKDNDFTVRSVIAKVKSLDIPYQVKDAKAKIIKEKPRSKADIVESVNKLLGRDLASLKNMTIADLLLLENELFNV